MLRQSSEFGTHAIYYFVIVFFQCNQVNCNNNNNNARNCNYPKEDPSPLRVLVTFRVQVTTSSCISTCIYLWLISITMPCVPASLNFSASQYWTQFIVKAIKDLTPFEQLGPIHQCTMLRAKVNDLLVWLSILPTERDNFDFTSQEFRYALAIRYRKPLLNVPAFCDGCGAPSTLEEGSATTLKSSTASLLKSQDLEIWNLAEISKFRKLKSWKLL